MFRIINLAGSSKYENFNEPKEFGLPGRSWIDFYRRTLKHARERIYPCSVHNCNKDGTHGGHVVVYECLNGNHHFRYYGIIPLCASHNGQREKLRSGDRDLIFHGETNFGSVLIKRCQIALLSEDRILSI